MTTNNRLLSHLAFAALIVILPRHLVAWLFRGVLFFIVMLVGWKHNGDPQSSDMAEVARSQGHHTTWLFWLGLIGFAYTVTIGARNAFRKQKYFARHGFPVGTGSLYQELTGRVTRPGSESGEDDNPAIRMPLPPYQPRPTVENPEPENVRRHAPSQNFVVQHQPTNVVKNDGIIYVATDVASSRKARRIEEHDGFTATDRRRFSGDN